MPFKMRNQNRFFRREKQNEIEMIEFLNNRYVVQAKRKVKGIMHYDLIGATGSMVEGIRFVGVPHGVITANRQVPDDFTFGDINKRYRH